MKKVLAIFVLFSSFLVILTACSTDNPEQTKQQNQQIKALNKWYKNDYPTAVQKMYTDAGDNYYASDRFIKDSTITGFKNNNGNVVVKASNNRLKAENISDKEIAKYAFNVILPMYEGKLDTFDNLDKNHNVKDQTTIVHDIELEQ